MPILATKRWRYLEKGGSENSSYLGSNTFTAIHSFTRGRI